MRNLYFFLLLFLTLFISAQEIVDKETFKKCRKEFNKKTCLADNDGDGILNYLDQCKDEAGPIENNGCPWPDSDFDGIFDKDDYCPEVAGPEENHGCPWPDTDGDGILDKDDECPTIAGLAEKNGCPEEKPYRFSDEQIEAAKVQFQEETKNFNYNKLADYIFMKLKKSDYTNDIITIRVASFHQMGGCGFDRSDYRIVNMKVNIASEKFWNERNFRKFTGIFSDKIIFPFSENKDVQKMVESYRLTYAKKVDGVTIYSGKNNFAKFNKLDLRNEIYNPLTIDIKFDDERVYVVLNEYGDFPKMFYELQIKDFLKK